MTDEENERRFTAGMADMKAILDAMPNDLKGNAPGCPPADCPYIDGWVAELLRRAVVYFTISSVITNRDGSRKAFGGLVKATWDDLDEADKKRRATAEPESKGRPTGRPFH